MERRREERREREREGEREREKSINLDGNAIENADLLPINKFETRTSTTSAFFPSIFSVATHLFQI